MLLLKQYDVFPNSKESIVSVENFELTLVLVPFRYTH